jgi:GTPase
MFCDQVEVTLKAGDGGDGFASFRREKFIARGGPDGGDGGRGGHVVLKVSSNLNTLFHLRKKPIHRGEEGVGGHRFDKAGRQGEDLILEIPPGTLVYSSETDDLIVDMVENGDEFILLHGGKGGFGNAHFTSSVRQAPDFAEKGEPGEELNVRFEMQLVADVGIIGLPSVGKSTLISRITDAKPKIAAYHFTTLIPNMGMVDLTKWGGSKGETFAVADVPGLIEGAHQGKGLGDEFLRHVSRTAMMVHVVDCQSMDMMKDYEVIMNELEAYDPKIANRPQVLVINKVDTIDEETRELLLQEWKAFLKKRKVEVPIFMISSVAGIGLKPLILFLWTEVQKLRKNQAIDREDRSKEGYRVFRPHLNGRTTDFEVEVVEEEMLNDEGEKEMMKVFVIRGKRIEQIVVMSDLEHKGALMRVYDVLEKMRIANEIRRLGGQMGDFVRIGKADIEFRG